MGISFGNGFIVVLFEVGMFQFVGFTDVLPFVGKGFVPKLGIFDLLAELIVRKINFSIEIVDPCIVKYPCYRFYREGFVNVANLLKQIQHKRQGRKAIVVLQYFIRNIGRDDNNFLEIAIKVER